VTSSQFQDGDFWEAGRQIVSTFWDAHAWLWHGYEIHGLENLPEDRTRGCLLVYYHGAIPVDYYYLVNRVFLLKRVVIHSVVDKFLFRVPGMRIILDVFCCTPGSVDSCAELLRQGALLGISPGGVYEAQFGDHSYAVLWRERLGFARAALQAGVPVVPVFTENIREAFRVVPFGAGLFYRIFERTKLPLRPLFGGFPVKLVTHIGPAIYPAEGMTPEALRDLCKAGLETLIAENQRRPGTIFHAIVDRFWRRRVHND
jgi:1-acyl-sn-glycerol-3-phosphate acyltransferase